FSTCSSFIAVGPGPRKCYIHAQCKWRTPLCSRMTLTSSSEADCISPRASFSNESTFAAAPQFPRVLRRCGGNRATALSASFHDGSLPVSPGPSRETGPRDRGQFSHSCPKKIQVQG